MSAGVRAAIAGRVHGSVEYSLTRARMARPGTSGYLLLLAPSALRARSPNTFTTSRRRSKPKCPKPPRASSCSTGSATRSRTPRRSHDARRRRSTRASTSRCGSRCRSWTSATPSGRCWSRSATSSARPPDQSIYDELLVVRPPKRIVGGLTLQVLEASATPRIRAIHNIEYRLRHCWSAALFFAS